MDRERRVTAGRRMTSLVGKALEDDEAFWDHDTWNDADEDGNDSFHSSDEDSELKRDEFDSDFDDSENEENVNAEEEERGRQEEAMLNLEERQLQRGKHASASSASYRDVASKASRSMAVRKQKGRQAVTGHGLNAGIVLNLPPPPPPTATPGNDLVSNAAPASLTTAGAAAALPLKPLASSSSSSAKAGLPTPLSIARTKPRRTITKPKRAAAESAARQMAFSSMSVAPSASAHAHAHAQQQQQRGGPPSPKSSSRATAAVVGATKKRKTTDATTTSRGGRGSGITQEQMILEAVHETEPENERWLLARERRMQESDAMHQQQSANNHAQHLRNATIVERFVSRRGYPNVISFPEMDHVPSILQLQHPSGRRGQSQSSGRNQPVCVITGKPAKYRDPKTGHAYHDLEAFRELRRRHDAGEPIVPNSSSNGTDGSAKALASEPAGTVPPEDASAEPSADNGAGKSNGAASVKPSLATVSNSNSSSSTTTSKTRIHIRAPAAIAAQPPATATNALPQPQPQTDGTETSPSAQISNSSPNPHPPQPPPLRSMLQAATAVSKQPTIPVAQLRAGASTTGSQAASTPSTASAVSEVAASAPTATPSATAGDTPAVPAKEVPTNVVANPVLSPLQTASSLLPPPPPPTTALSGSSINSRTAIVSAEPVTPRASTTPVLSSGPAVPAARSVGPSTHPAVDVPLPLSVPGLTIRASPRQRKPTAKVLHGSP